ncbi:unnamed protein product [Microthlaspi erraticum]|uniref:Uncharacterized protein n=1 Tax=Microthlaspi erraticum TaxID=1685480 RepID=A0A6D2HFA8_9BRAS|nr:unnamed protein product [Microthlaspi erraticum]
MFFDGFPTVSLRQFHIVGKVKDVGNPSKIFVGIRRKYLPMDNRGFIHNGLGRETRGKSTGKRRRNPSEIFPTDYQEYIDNSRDWEIRRKCITYLFNGIWSELH